MAFELKARHFILTPSTFTFGLGIIYEEWEDPTTKKTKRYWKYTLPDVVQIMGLTPENRIIVVGEFQPGVGTTYPHLPAETLEEDEGWLAAAKRGLREETGYEGDEPILVSSVLENSGRSDRVVYMVLILNCKKIGDGEEDIKVSIVNRQDFWRNLMDYFLLSSHNKHGAGNSLKLAALVFQSFGWIKVDIKDAA